MWKTLEEIEGHNHLVELCPEIVENTVFVTISPNPKAKVARFKIDKKTKLLTYGQLDKTRQYRFLIRYVEGVYNWDTIEKGLCVFELNSSDQLHCHLLLQFKHKATKYDIGMLRDHVRMNIRTIPHLTRGKDYMNNIVPVTDSIDDRIKYLEKDIYESMRYFNPLYL